MLASPSIQEIASALAQTSLPPIERDAQKSRILCLKMNLLPPAPGFKRGSSTSGVAEPKAVAEAFLKYSPRVHLRLNKPSELDTALSFWLFIDVASTSHLFVGDRSERVKGSARRKPNDQQHHGEEGLMHSALSLARDLGFSAQCAIADTPAGAQAFALSHHGTIIPMGEERERLKELSLPLLLHLEGLRPWDRPSVIEGIVTFFMMLGFKKMGDLSRFTFASLQERWGESGAILWRRVNAQERQVVSPFRPTEPLQDEVHLDFSISLVSLLMHQVEKSMNFLFARLQGRRLVARRLRLILECEYAKTKHQIDLEPTLPSRDRDLFLTLLETRLSELSLENPIRDFTIQVLPVPEKSRQLDFFANSDGDEDRLVNLMSVLKQSSLKPGHYQIVPAILPEQGWRLTTSDARAYRSQTAVSGSSSYGESVMQAPRPTRILQAPLPLSLEELERLQILSTHPIERLENGWWGDHESRRDYYFAVSPEGQCLWIFQDLRTEDYFLHGYFD